jgi:DNA-binding CsgD family transcriptional regulator
MLRPTTQFVQTVSSYSDPGEVLDALTAVAKKLQLNGFGASLIGLGAKSRTLNETVFFPSTFPAEEWFGAYHPRLVEKGDAVSDYVRGRAGPITLTEATRALRLTGDERWLIDLLRRFHMRDVLFCPTRRWMLRFNSHRDIIRIDQFERQLLAWAASAAAEQMGRLVKRQRPIGRPDLSPREVEVLRLRALGLKNPAAARQMGIGFETVASYLKRAMVKLDAKDVTEAVANAMRLGLLPDGP